MLVTVEPFQPINLTWRKVSVAKRRLKNNESREWKTGKEIVDGGINGPEYVRPISCWYCGKIGILPNGQMHVGLNVSGTTSWKQEVMPSLPHLFWIDETKNVVWIMKCCITFVEKLLGHSQSIFGWCLQTEKGAVRCQCYKTFYGRKLQFFIISWSVCSWQNFSFMWGKCSSLLWKVVTYGRKKFYNIGPRYCYSPN